MVQNFKAEVRLHSTGRIYILLVRLRSLSGRSHAILPCPTKNSLTIKPNCISKFHLILNLALFEIKIISHKSISIAFPKVLSIIVIIIISIIVIIIIVVSLIVFVIVSVKAHYYYIRNSSFYLPSLHFLYFYLLMFVCCCYLSFFSFSHIRVWYWCMSS